MAATKRPRTPSSSSSLVTASGPSPSTDPPQKASRIHPSDATSNPSQSPKSANGGHPIICSLPPTCHRRPTPIGNTNDLERHYAMYHAHVCEGEGCGCVFPEERFLALHQTECHNPIAALRKERNEKIFECHIPAPGCGRSFLTPKARRLHLIQVHNYPKQYFFAITNKGIGGLLKKWGEGASLIRKEWKPRESRGKDDMKMDEDQGNDEENDTMDESDESAHATDHDEPADLEATPRIRPGRILSPATSHSSKGSDNPRYSQQSSSNADIAGLTQSLHSLTLVPSSVRFGRGGKTKGFSSSETYNRGSAGAKVNRNTTRSTNVRSPMDVDQDKSYDRPLHLPMPAKGVPFHSRGRGRRRGGL